MPLAFSEILVSELFTTVRARFRTGSAPPNAAFQDTQMLQTANDIQEWFHFWPVDNGMFPFPFNRGEHLFESITNTQIATKISAQGVKLVVDDSSSFEDPAGSSVGVLYLRESNTRPVDFCTYEENDESTTFTVVDDVDIDHAVDEEVHQLYKMPPNFGRGRILKVEGQDYEWIDAEFEDLPPPFYFHVRPFTSKNGNTGWFVVLPEDLGNRTCKIFYAKQPTEITAKTQKMFVPKGVARQAIIEKFGEYIWETRGEDDRAQIRAAKAEEFMNIFASNIAMSNSSVAQGPIYDF